MAVIKVSLWVFKKGLTSLIRVFPLDPGLTGTLVRTSLNLGSATYLSLPKPLAIPGFSASLWHSKHLVCARGSLSTLRLHTVGHFCLLEALAFLVVCWNYWPPIHRLSGNTRPVYWYAKTTGSQSGELYKWYWLCFSHWRVPAPIIFSADIISSLRWHARVTGSLQRQIGFQRRFHIGELLCIALAHSVAPYKRSPLTG